MILRPVLFPSSALGCFLQETPSSFLTPQNFMPSFITSINLLSGPPAVFLSATSRPIILLPLCNLSLCAACPLRVSVTSPASSVNCQTCIPSCCPSNPSYLLQFLRPPALPPVFLTFLTPFLFILFSLLNKVPCFSAAALFADPETEKVLIFTLVIATCDGSAWEILALVVKDSVSSSPVQLFFATSH